MNENNGEPNGKGHLEAFKWKPGQSGNPKGRPKGRTLTSILREVLDGNTLEGLEIPAGMTVADYFVRMMISHAIEGDSAIAKEIWMRIEGKIPERVQIQNMALLSNDELRAIVDGESSGRIRMGMGDLDGSD